jgi:hypothetical protein
MGISLANAISKSVRGANWLTGRAFINVLMSLLTNAPRSGVQEYCTVAMAIIANLRT